jgi:helix-turn-helix protein
VTNASSRDVPLLYRPAEVAKKLRCSEWWIKEQARNRRIPFSWIGGSYRFTDDHIAEIVRLFEERPDTFPIEVVDTSGSRPKKAHKPPATRLKARTPRRALNARRSTDAA